MECPDERCAERLDETHHAIFKDENGGCRFDIKGIKLQLTSLIKKRHLWIVCIVIGLPAYSAFANIWAGDKVRTSEMKAITIAQQKFTIESSNTQKQVIRLEERIKHISENLEEMKEQQQANTNKIIEAIIRRRVID